MNHALFFVFLIVSASAFASMEIQVEGPNGWASGMYTWRIQNRFTKLLLGARPLTGYHVSVQFFLILIMHSPFYLGLVGFSLIPELRIFSFLMLFWVLEDFLYFVLHPLYGIARFRKEFIWWHRATWLWFMPREYWVAIPLAGLLYVLSYKPSVL